MFHAKNYETACTFLKGMHYAEKTSGFFPDRDTF